MLKSLFGQVSNLLAPLQVGHRSYDSLPSFAVDDDDVMERGGRRGFGAAGGGSGMAYVPPIVDEEERALASFSQNLPSEERMRLIYLDVKKTSEQVRLSNLYVYDMISTIETIRGAGPLGQDEYRDVMWMTATHLYMDIIMHNRKPGGAFPYCKVHIGTLASMAMRGVYKTHVNACADLVWRTLYAQGYELYSEDGKLLKEAPAAPAASNQEEMGKEEEEEKEDSPIPSPRVPHPPPRIVKMSDNINKQSAKPFIGTTRVYEEDMSPPDVDATTMDGLGRRTASGAHPRPPGAIESSKDK